jgi:hypothetical protein
MTILSILAQTFTPQGPSAGDVAINLIPMMIGIAIAFAISVVVCFLLYNVQNAVPPQHRKIQPGMIWLMLIPLFNLVWNFFVFMRIPESYQSVFAERGRGDLGATEKQLGLWYSICAACTLIPCLGLFAALGALVLLILFLVKIYGLKAQLQSGGSGGFPVSPPGAPQV